MMPPVAPVVRLRDRLRAALPDLAIPTLMYAVYIGVLVWIAPQTTHVPGEFWQLLPAEALLERPWRSLLFLHAQPPLYNVLYAGVLHLEQATGWAAARIAMVLMTGFGWLACVAWFRVAAALMGSRR